RPSRPASRSQRHDDRWDDHQRGWDDQRGWDESDAWAPGGGGGLWGDADHGYSAQAPTPEWPGAGGRGQAGAKNGTRAKGAKSGATSDWRARVRFWMTKDAWRMSLLRTWPSLARLMVAIALLGTCGGLAAFMTRAQEGTVGGVGQHRADLVGQHVGPGTPTPDLYQSDPFTPPPLPTATPTKAKTTPTTSPVQLQVGLSPTQAQCNGGAGPLPPVTLTLDNSRSQVAVQWTLALGPGPSGAGTWAQASPGSTGTLPAGGAPQGVTLTPDPTLCAQLAVAGQPGRFTAQVTTTPGGQTNTQTFTVLPFSSGGSTPTPTSGVTPSPSPPKP
ncbi:MAG TPA: hypothetical protein VFY89_02380, partial [Ktedonobacterales bacterium]